MELRVLLRNSGYVLALFLISCNQQKQVLPAQSANTRQGITSVLGKSFTGTLFTLSGTGDTLETTSYVDGKADGEARQWYSRNRLKEIRHYTNGNKTNEHKGWWPNGKQKFVYHFTEGKFNGEIKEWYTNGQVYRLSNYKDGYEDGLQKRYYEDGRLQANYEARNGRNYGNIGFKNCESPVRPDSISSVP